MTNLLNSSNVLSKCSVKDCNNQTRNFFESKKQKIYICDECFTKLAEYAIARRTPKSPTNKVKQVMAKRQEEGIYD